jgi:uroporphyrinogen-III synthase
MAILVTRPSSDNEATAARLRALGFEVVCAPVLRLEPATFRDDPDTDYSAVIVTSANALRAVEPQLEGHRLLKLPLFAVGEHTAEAARRIGFTKVMTAEGDVGTLRDLVLKSATVRRPKKGSTLLYLAGADVSRDLAGELSAHGLHVVTQTTYRMTPISNLPREACDAFAANAVEAVLHYSGRSARAFLDAARADGVEISALSVPQCCLSESIAAVLRDAGATQVAVATSPDENALLAALERALRSRLA